MASLTISIIALAFSATSIGWNIYQYYDKLKRKITIKYKSRDCYAADGSYITTDTGFAVTNIGQIPITIDRFEIFTDVTNETHVSGLDIVKEFKTPIKIESGERVEMWIYGHIATEIKRNNGAKKVKLVAYDTLDKKYESDYITLR